MSKTNIEWATDVWNPLAGCTRASAGCDNCYAAKMSLRLEAMAEADIAAGKDPGGKSKYMGIATKNGKGVPVFNGKINLDWDELQRPFRWKKPRLVFVNSMSDLFHKDVPDGFIVDVFNVMHDSPAHTFQVLTKRPERAAAWARKVWGALPDNVWIGTSVENQETADERIPELLKIPAAVRFLSCEPLLGPIDLMAYLYPVFAADDPRHYPRRNGVEWVIVGGESGPNARPMHPDWARSLRDQCQTAGVPFFFKQWGEWLPIVRDSLDFEYNENRGNTDWSARTYYLDKKHSHTEKVSVKGDKGNKSISLDPGGGCMMGKVGKKAAGRLLDGREWNEMPATAVNQPQQNHS